MKRVIYAALVILAFLVPTVPQELGKLIPVEVIRIKTEEEMILIETDTGDVGAGDSLEPALRDLKATAPGTVYLDTAEYVLLPAEKEAILDEMIPYLKDTVRICCWEGEVDIKEVAAFLDVHSPNVDLEQYQKGKKVQILVAESGRLRLEEKSQK